MSKEKTPRNPSRDPAKEQENYWQKKQQLNKEGRKLYIQKIFKDWCKGCGICIAFCPAEVFAESEGSLPVIKDADACTGCRFCEFHCPDFALSIHERFPDRRKKNDGS